MYLLIWSTCTSLICKIPRPLPPRYHAYMMFPAVRMRHRTCIGSLRTTTNQKISTFTSQNCSFEGSRRNASLKFEADQTPEDEEASELIHGLILFGTVITYKFPPWGDTIARYADEIFIWELQAIAPVFRNCTADIACFWGGS
jgi:hypothetical protein